MGNFIIHYLHKLILSRDYQLLGITRLGTLSANGTCPLIRGSGISLNPDCLIIFQDDGLIRSSRDFQPLSSGEEEIYSLTISPPSNDDGQSPLRFRDPTDLTGDRTTKAPGILIGPLSDDTDSAGSIPARIIPDRKHQSGWSENLGSEQ